MVGGANQKALAGLDSADLKVVIAYEPVGPLGRVNNNQPTG